MEMINRNKQKKSPVIERQISSIQLFSNKGPWNDNSKLIGSNSTNTKYSTILQLRSIERQQQVNQKQLYKYQVFSNYSAKVHSMATTGQLEELYKYQTTTFLTRSKGDREKWTATTQQDQETRAKLIYILL